MGEDWAVVECFDCFIRRGVAAPNRPDIIRIRRARETLQTLENTSGQGSLAAIPIEITGWNWGAFFFGWLWGISNGVMISLLTLVPYVGAIMFIVLGVKGNEWAWRNRRWDSIEHFRNSQRKWGIASAVVFLLSVIMLLFIFFSFPSDLPPIVNS
jgi:hypothetical protein